MKCEALNNFGSDCQVSHPPAEASSGPAGGATDRRVESMSRLTLPAGRVCQHRRPGICHRFTTASTAMRATDALGDALAKVAAMQASLSTANARIKELELLVCRQNERVVSVMRQADNAEQRCRELHAKRQVARRR